jgi:hypothetical protein
MTAMAGYGRYWRKMAADTGVESLGYRRGKLKEGEE